MVTYNIYSNYGYNADDSTAVFGGAMLGDTKRVQAEQSFKILQTHRMRRVSVRLIRYKPCSRITMWFWKPPLAADPNQGNIVIGGAAITNFDDICPLNVPTWVSFDFPDYPNILRNNSLVYAGTTCGFYINARNPESVGIRYVSTSDYTDGIFSIYDFVANKRTTYTNSDVVFSEYGYGEPYAEVGVTVSPTSGLFTTEAGGKATFDIVLNTLPTDNVTIGISSSNEAEGTVSPSSVVFTTSNWNIPQTVTITGQDDGSEDGDVDYTIVTTNTSSSDTDYDNLEVSDVSVTNKDNDIPGITVNPTSGLVTTDEGGQATFSIVLNCLPESDVTIGLHSSDVYSGTISQSIVTFTTTNWNVPQIITISGQRFNSADGDVVYSILIDNAISNDADYSDMEVSDVSVTNTHILNLPTNPRWRTQDTIHIFTPSQIVQSEYTLERANHRFYVDSDSSGIVMPNEIIVKTPDGDIPVYEGRAIDATSHNTNPCSRTLLVTEVISSNQAQTIANTILANIINAKSGSSALVPMNCGTEIFDRMKIFSKRSGRTLEGTVGSITRVFDPMAKEPRYDMQVGFGKWFDPRAKDDSLGYGYGFVNDTPPPEAGVDSGHISIMATTYHSKSAGFGQLADYMVAAVNEDEIIYKFQSGLGDYSFNIAGYSSDALISYVYVDDNKIGEWDAADYRFFAKTTLSSGEHTIKIKITDDSIDTVLWIYHIGISKSTFQGTS